MRRDPHFLRQIAVYVIEALVVFVPTHQKNDAFIEKKKASRFSGNSEQRNKHEIRRQAWDFIACNLNLKDSPLRKFIFLW